MGKILHNEESGFFPFCYTQTPTSNPFLGPDLFPNRWTSITASLYDAMGLYWRVREYEISGKLYNPIGPPQLPLVYPFTLKIRSTAQNEEELVCYRGFEVIPPLPSYETEDGETLEFKDLFFDLFPAQFSATTLGLIPVYGATNPVSYSAPCLFVYSQILIQVNDESSNFNTDSEGSGGGAITFSQIRAYGNIVTFRIWANESPIDTECPEPGACVNVLSGIVATEYWSYGGLYSTETGLVKDNV